MDNGFEKWREENHPVNNRPLFVSGYDTGSKAAYDRLQAQIEELEEKLAACEKRYRDYFHMDKHRSHSLKKDQNNE